MERVELVIASGNPHKIAEIAAMLEVVDQVKLLSQPDGIDIEETGATYADNARLKAETVARITGRWTLADDSGLSVDALGGAPGVYSARYAPSDPERIGRLLLELEGHPYRSAAFHSALALADPAGEIVLESEGVCRGEVLVEPVKAARSYGYNSVFYVREAGCTYAEMSDHQMSKLGSRAKAARLLAPALKELLGINPELSG
ncbi:MAG: RdgB/HAM1 family non-canonical purine NTP pyrophosphatase [Cyanobacteria bacterium]|nr:RdgB/HAM1 family non-canonical purine NTP pyrophosphatase [Cyanobacteria bacterium bin.51]